jgi:hypothetical protein
MNQDELLTVLKKDLQITTTANDEYLTKLLSFSKDLMTREGIILDDSLECQMIQVHYAAYLFRRRGGSETSMPRFLRYELNNLLLSQKGKT